MTNHPNRARMTPPETHLNEIAFAAGRAFAAWLNATPAEAQNWRRLVETDDLPEGDYLALRDQCDTMTPEMERAYRDGFNATFEEPNNA